MDDLISRKAALDAIGEEPTVWNVDDDITIGERAQWRADVLAIKTLPAAKPESGEWVEEALRRYHCSKCGGLAPEGVRWSFCPHCGRELSKTRRRKYRYTT